MKINCEAMKYRNIFVLADGTVLPCCHMSGTPLQPYYEKHSDGDDNLHNNTLEEILENKLFNTVKEGWEDEDKLCHACKKTCQVGREFNDEFRYEELA